jgi:hypothetical protein
MNNKRRDLISMNLASSSNCLRVPGNGIYKPIINRTANKVGLFCNARDEKNIKEWAAHHLLLGFDYIIIFDHKSIIPLTEVFKNFDKRVSIIRIDMDKVNGNDKNIKKHLMNKAINIALKMNFDWFIYLDADEFLILNKFFKGVKHFLNSYSYADSLGVNWVMFGSNNLVEEPDGLILENYTQSSLTLNQHVKSFVRPREAKFSSNPHYYSIKDPSKMLGINFKKINYPQCWNKLNMPFYNSPAYIAHYVYQSEETYKKRKVKLIGDDGSVRGDMGKEIHKLYNEIINLQPQKYVKQIKEFLQHYV